MRGSEDLDADFYVKLGSAVAGVYSFVVLCFFMISYFIDKPFCFPTSWNDMGDAISGFLSPLVLLFFIISVLIQRSEFRLSRAEMVSSTRELENQVLQMKFSGMAGIFRDDLETIHKSFSGSELKTIDTVYNKYHYFDNGEFVSILYRNLKEHLNEKIEKVLNLSEKDLFNEVNYLREEAWQIFSSLSYEKDMINSLINIREKMNAYIGSYLYLSKLYEEVDDSFGARNAFLFSKISIFHKKISFIVKLIDILENDIKNKSIEKNFLIKFNVALTKRDASPLNITI